MNTAELFEANKDAQTLPEPVGYNRMARTEGRHLYQGYQIVLNQLKNNSSSDNFDQIGKNQNC